MRVHQWQFDVAFLAGGVVDALRCLPAIFRLCPEDIGNKSLGIAVVKREPTGLDLHRLNARLDRPGQEKMKARLIDPPPADGVSVFIDEHIVSAGFYVTLGIIGPFLLPEFPGVGKLIVHRRARRYPPMQQARWPMP